MDPILTAALAPVLRDLTSTRGPQPRIENHDWAGLPDQVGVMLWSSTKRGGTGVSVLRSASAAERVASVADQVQEWAVEDLWGHAPTNWPPCPHHPTTHPLQAVARDGVAVWTCPVDDVVVASVGQL